MAWRSSSVQQREQFPIALEPSLWLFLGEFPAAGMALRDTVEAWGVEEGDPRDAVSPR